MQDQKIHPCPGFNTRVKTCNGTVCPMSIPHIRATCPTIRRQEPCMKGADCDWWHSHPALRLRVDQIRSSQGRQRGISSTFHHLKAIEYGSANMTSHAKRREGRRQQRRRKSLHGPYSGRSSIFGHQAPISTPLYERQVSTLMSRLVLYFDRAGAGVP